MARERPDLYQDDDQDTAPTAAGWKDDVTPEKIEATVADDDGELGDLLDGAPDWELSGIGRMTADGEERYDATNSAVNYVTIDDARHLDPPKQMPSRPPQPRTTETDLSDYAG
jgi:hypothetical protein